MTISTKRVSQVELKSGRVQGPPAVSAGTLSVLGGAHMPPGTSTGIHTSDVLYSTSPTRCQGRHYNNMEGITPLSQLNLSSR